MSEDKTAETRRGLLTGIKGKMKEIAGAVSGNESLIGEGQLQQAEAQSVRDANAKQAIADAESGAATAELQAEHSKTAQREEHVLRQAAGRKAAATVRKDAQEQAIAARAAREGADDVAAAQQQAAREEQAALERAAVQKRAAIRQETAAQTEHARQTASADAARKAADRARVDAARLADDAGSS
jgi:uncharacterized protein YjbJ (UPF0337 family)